MNQNKVTDPGNILQVEEIKNNSFTLRKATLPLDSQYKTISSMIYNHKGDASKLRAVLDEHKKQELRINHF